MLRFFGGQQGVSESEFSDYFCRFVDVLLAFDATSDIVKKLKYYNYGNNHESKRITVRTASIT